MEPNESALRRVSTRTARALSVLLTAVCIAAVGGDSAQIGTADVGSAAKTETVYAHGPKGSYLPIRYDAGTPSDLCCGMSNASGAEENGDGENTVAENKTAFEFLSMVVIPDTDEIQIPLSRQPEITVPEPVPEVFEWPLDPEFTYITSPFGLRDDPFTGEVSSDYHGGTDINAPCGVNIYASKSGTVVISTYNDSYGNFVMIDHGDGVSTLYAHCSELLVAYGQEVRQGDVIARVGRTGSATNYHLHFEVQIYGVRDDAMKYVSPYSVLN